MVSGVFMERMVTSSPARTPRARRPASARRIWSKNCRKDQVWSPQSRAGWSWMASFPCHRSAKMGWVIFYSRVSLGPPSGFRSEPPGPPALFTAMLLGSMVTFRSIRPGMPEAAAKLLH